MNILTILHWRTEGAVVARFFDVPHLDNVRTSVSYLDPLDFSALPDLEADSNVAKLITIAPIDQRSEGKSIPEERLSNFEIEC
jgi:hypothetical protein